MDASACLTPSWRLPRRDGVCFPLVNFAKSKTLLRAKNSRLATLIPCNPTNLERDYSTGCQRSWCSLG
jgi:hypothetical protein